MNDNPVLKFIEEQDALAPLEESAQTAVRSAYESAGETGQFIKDALHGKWLGHPFHAMITDVPVGSWTTAAVLDVLEVNAGERYAAGADAAIALGLTSAVAAAISGITDWSETQGSARRVGITHGLLNVTTALIYMGSLAARKSGRRTLGRWLGFSGFTTLMAGAYLGGELSYKLGVGVDE
jgi:uncharacterized membrane protein